MNTGLEEARLDAARDHGQVVVRGHTFKGGIQSLDEICHPPWIFRPCRSGLREDSHENDVVGGQEGTFRAVMFHHSVMPRSATICHLRRPGNRYYHQAMAPRPRTSRTTQNIATIMLMELRGNSRASDAQATNFNDSTVAHVVNAIWSGAGAAKVDGRDHPAVLPPGASAPAGAVRHSQVPGTSRLCS